MKQIKLGSGKYRFIGDYSTDLHEFKVAFIEAFQKFVPESVESLRKIAPVYQELLELWTQFQDSAMRPGIYQRFSVEGSIVPLGLNRNASTSSGLVRLPSFAWDTLTHADRSFYPDLLPLKTDMVQWGNRWHMTDADWFMEAGLSTLKAWAAHPKLFQLGEFNLGGSGDWAAVLEHESRFLFEDSGWTPNIEHWVDIEKRIRARFESELAIYKAGIVEIAESRGFRRVPNKVGPEHFVWLVLFQCAEWRLDSIREKYGTSVSSRQAVHTAIKSAAGLIELTLRAGRTRTSVKK